MQRRSGLCAWLIVLHAGAASAAAPAALESSDGMVVSAQHNASEVGAAVLGRGGNAIDAAVAVGYALAVAHPCCGNLGGGGFMLIHLADGRDTFLNFREKAPLAARADMFLDSSGNPDAERSVNGYLAVAVPGSVMGLERARERYGTMSRAALIGPARRLAAEGFALTRGDVDVLVPATEQFRGEPNVARIFLKEGAAWQPGDVLVQKDLEATLAAIDAGGPDAFYRGVPAKSIATASAARGGILSAEDFAAYTVSESPPLSCRYRGFTVLSAPPPSSGGVTLCEMLQILEFFPLKSMGFHSSESVHVMTEAMRFAYHDRNSYLGDPDFIDNPVARLLSARHALSIAARIKPRQANRSSNLTAAGFLGERASTTHYSVADRLGNVVAVTYTIDDNFGAKVIAADTGFFLNDEMDDFTAKPGTPNMFGLVQGSANAVAAGKRPLSSMTPTLVLDHGKVVLSIGTPGGARIITTVLEIIVNIIDHGMSIQEAVDAPRIHHQWLPDTLAAEPFALSADTERALVRMGYHLEVLPPWGTGNAAQVIAIAPGTAGCCAALNLPRPGRMYGASDSRAPAGSAAAPP